MCSEWLCTWNILRIRTDDYGVDYYGSVTSKRSFKESCSDSSNNNTDNVSGKEVLGERCYKQGQGFCINEQCDRFPSELYRGRSGFFNVERWKPSK